MMSRSNLHEHVNVCWQTDDGWSDGTTSERRRFQVEGEICFHGFFLLLPLSCSFSDYRGSGLPTIVNDFMTYNNKINVYGANATIRPG